MRRHVALVLYACFCAAGASAQAVEAPAALAVGEYADQLDAIASALEENDRPAAAHAAAALAAREIVFEDERLLPDRGLLAAAMEARREPPRTLSRRYRVLAAAVRGVAPPDRVAEPDRQIVQRLREADRIARGGAVPDPSIPPLSISERVIEAIGDAAAWIADRLRDLWRWLRKLWPRDAADKASSGGALTFTLAVVALAVLLLVLLAVRTVRRSRPQAAEIAPPAAPAAADADPLSREANEWEAYARELMAAGRRREAVRAWYHAVLSALFRTGLLEPRKGRTNWEHVARLPADLPWRAQLVRMTRDFEREWYGRDESTTEVLRDCQQLARSILQSVHAGAAP